MIPKSIKLRLQLWYGLMLVAVLVGFGLTALQLEYGRQSARLERELEHRFAVIANSLHPRPPEPHRPPFDGPPPAPTPDDFRPRPNPRPMEFHLPPQDATLFDANDPNDFFYFIARRGAVFAQSTNALLYTGEKPPHYPRTMVIARPLPSGEFVGVGCSVAPEMRELKLTAWKYLAVGGIILFFGLAVGGRLISRALRPIGSISSTAVKISAGDLSQRINVAEAESELGQLATVLNATFARLEAAFAQQRQFTADAAHELRTPVSVMLTQTQTALNRERSGAEYRETLEACQRASQRMRKLIGSLLELARLDAGQEPMKRLKFDLSQTVRDCAELVRPLAAERGVTIHCDLPAVDAHGDAERLAQVVTNLLANAIQYNRANGEVRVSAKLQDGMVRLAVSDTGTGISGEDLPHVFERFYRADQSRSSGQTGLGLAISKAIVEAHGGAIAVSSQPGGGTTFTVALPG